MNHKKIWALFYSDNELVMDYAGRLINLEFYGDQDSIFGWNIDHINPLSNTGSNNYQNLVPVHFATNIEKADSFPHWDANGKKFKAVKKSNNSRKGYYIIETSVFVPLFENID